MASNSHRASSTETAVVDALLEARGNLVGLLDAEVCVVLDELAARRRVLDAALVEVAGEVLRRADESPVEDSLPRKVGFRNLPEMLQQVLGVRLGEAKTLVTVAQATRTRMGFTGEPIRAEYPAVAEVVASGVVSVAQAAAITKGLDATAGRADPEWVDAAEAELVASACGLNLGDEVPAVPEVLSVQANTWVSFLDPDGEEPRDERASRERGLWLFQRPDGTLAGKFVATREQGDALQSILDVEVSPRRKPQFFETSCGEPNATALGANVELNGDPNCTDPRDPEFIFADSRSLAQKRMDALEMIVARYAEGPDAPRTGGEAPTIVILTTREGLLGEQTRPEDGPHLERTGEPVPASFAAKILCDGFVRVATLDGNGEILDLGRKQRLFSSAQRRAIASRDRMCRVAGCYAPVRWCEAHHTTSWVEGGLTDAKDGILICSYHHHEVHRGNLKLVRGQNGLWRVVPDGNHHVVQRRARRFTKPPSRTPWNKSASPPTPERS